jgi:hypothetical protein
VTQVAAAVCAGGFDPVHTVAAIIVKFNCPGFGYIIKARPTRSAIKFGFTAKKLCPAGGTGICAAFFIVQILAAKRRLRAPFAQDAVLLRR